MRQYNNKHINKVVSKLKKKENVAFEYLRKVVNNNWNFKMVSKDIKAMQVKCIVFKKKVPYTTVVEAQRNYLVEKLGRTIKTSDLVGS